MRGKGRNKRINRGVDKGRQDVDVVVTQALPVLCTQVHCGLCHLGAPSQAETG